MSREIARSIIKARMKELRKLSYEELVKLVGQIRCDHIDVPDDEEYQLEIETRWDSKTGGNIRVMVAVDGPGVSAFRPLTEAFIMSADGSFVGEN